MKTTLKLLVCSLMITPAWAMQLESGFYSNPASPCLMELSYEGTSILTKVTQVKKIKSQHCTDAGKEIINTPVQGEVDVYESVGAYLKPLSNNSLVLGKVFEDLTAKRGEVYRKRSK